MAANAAIFRTEHTFCQDARRRELGARRVGDDRNISIREFEVLPFPVRSTSQTSSIWRYVGPKRVILLLGLGSLVFLAWKFYRADMLTPNSIERYRDQHPAGAVILFLLIYATTVVASLPSLPLNLAAGFFWGGVAGGIYTTLGVTVGSWISFAFARWTIGQPLAGKFDNKWASRVQREFDRQGWKFVAFARINPIIPTGPLNYLLGLTSVSNKVFLAATFVFLLPLSTLVAYIGAALQTFTVRQAGISDVIKVIFAVSATLTFLALIKFVSTIKSAGDE